MFRAAKILLLMASVASPTLLVWGTADNAWCQSADKAAAGSPAGTDGRVTSTVKVPNPEWPLLQEQFKKAKAELDIATLERHMTEQHPAVQELRKKIEELTKRIEQTPKELDLLSLAPLAANAQRKTFYVDQGHPSASDANAGTLDKPLKTVQRGVDMAGPGDTVFIRGSADPTSPSAVYRTAGHGIIAKRPGLPGAPITIAAYPGHRVIIDGTGSNWGIGLDNASFHVFRGLAFRNFNKAAEGWAPKTDILIERCEFSQTRETGLRLRNISNLIMRDCYVHHCFEAGIYVSGGDNALFERVESSFNSSGGSTDADGFSCYTTGTVRYVDCVAKGNADGFDLTGNCFLTNCISCSNVYCNVKLWRRDFDGYAAKSTTIMNSLFYGAGEAGIKVSAGAALNLYSSVVYGNKEEGVAFRGIGITQPPSAVTSKVTNTIIAKNGWFGIDVQQKGPNRNDVAADHNLYFGNDKPNLGLASDTGAVTDQDPLFLAPANGDFHLRPGSPAIDKALPLGEVAADFDRHARPFGTAPDIGAFEFTASPPGPPLVANDDEFTVRQDGGEASLEVLANDKPADSIDALAIVGTTAAAHGKVSIAAGGLALRYLPAAGYTGPDSFTYTAGDRRGRVATAVVHITVAPTASERQE